MDMHPSGRNVSNSHTQGGNFSISIARKLRMGKFLSPLARQGGQEMSSSPVSNDESPSFILKIYRLFHLLCAYNLCIVKVEIILSKILVVLNLQII